MHSEQSNTTVSNVRPSLHPSQGGGADKHGKSVLNPLINKRNISWNGVAGHSQIVEDVADVAGELADGGSDAIAALGLDDADSKSAQAGNVLRPVAGTQGAAVFIPVPVENVVAGLDTPVVAIEGEQTTRIGGFGGVAGQAIDDLSGFPAGFFVDDIALDRKGLADAGEGQVVVEFGGGPDGAGLQAPVSQGEILTKVGLPAAFEEQADIG